jgi:hypothetical protein
VPSSSTEQVEHLLWIISKLCEVIPVVHARFGGATMAQKYGGLMGDTSEPFVLGGNPLIDMHAAGQDLDAWIESQMTWSNDEIAEMLRELAIEIATSNGGGEDDDETTMTTMTTPPRKRRAGGRPIFEVSRPRRATKPMTTTTTTK